MNATVSPNAARWQRDLKSDDSEKRFGRLEGIVPGESTTPVRFFSLDEPWTDRGPARNVFFLLSLTAVRSRQRTTSVCLNFGGKRTSLTQGAGHVSTAGLCWVKVRFSMVQWASVLQHRYPLAGCIDRTKKIGGPRGHDQSDDTRGPEQMPSSSCRRAQRKTAPLCARNGSTKARCALDALLVACGLHCWLGAFHCPTLRDMA